MLANSGSLAGQLALHPHCTHHAGANRLQSTFCLNERNRLFTALGFRNCERRINGLCRAKPDLLFNALALGSTRWPPPSLRWLPSIRTLVAFHPNVRPIFLVVIFRSEE